MGNDRIPEKLLHVNKNKIWYSNLNWEQTVEPDVKLPSIRNEAGDQLVRRMDIHQIFLADREDTVLVLETPDLSFLELLKDRGIALPKLVEGARDAHPSLFDKALAVPYLMDEEEERFLRKHDCRWIGPPAHLALLLNHKVRTRMMCEQHGFHLSEGMICRSADELNQAHQIFSDRYPGSRFVVKNGYGSAGKNLFHIYKKDDMQFLTAYLRRNRKESGFLLSFERWHDTAFNLNSQLFIQDGRTHLLAVTSQYTNQVGVYKGSDLNPVIPEKLMESYHSEMLRLGSVVSGMGYRGFMGVDSFVDTTGQLIPVIEINARLTMVTYLLSIRNRKLGEGFPRMTTQSYDFSLDTLLDFGSFYELTAGSGINVPNETGDLLIYGYHRFPDEVNRRHMYRVFVMYWALSDAKLNSLKAEFEQSLAKVRGERH